MADSNTKLLDFTMLQRYHELLQPLILSIFNENMPDSLPASDVSSWAKQATKPKYTASEVGADAAGSAATALSEAKTYAQTYVDDEINALIGGADSTKDTLKELADAIAENSDLMDTLNSAIGKKANASDLTSHTSNKSNPHGVTLAQLGVTSTAAELNLLDGVTATTAEINYLDGVTSAIQTQLNAKAANKNMTGATASAAGAAGLVPAPATGANGKFLRGDGTWATPTNTTYSAATASALGLVKIGSNITNDSGTISLTKDNVTAALGYTPSESDTVYSHPTSGVTAGTYRSVTVNAQGHVTAGSNPTITVAQGGTGATNVSAAAYNIFGDIRESTSVITDNTPIVAKYDTPSESAGVFHWRKASVIWEYIKGKISSILGLTATQYNGNAKTATTATNATKVNNLTVETAVPANAKFTDTTYSNMTAATASAAGKAGLVPAPAAGKQTSFLRGDGTWATPTNTTYSAATASALGLVKIGSNITNDSGTISLTKANVTAALGYTPPTTNTTYSNFVKSGSGAAAGLVPAPSTTAGTTKYLREDGTWVAPPNTTYSAATASALGLVKIGSNITNDSGTISLTKANVTAALGYTPPTTNTTYSAATTSAAGLMAAADKTKLDATNVAYCTCATAAGTAAKVLTVVGNTNWKLTTGSIIIVNPSYTNTASNPTFNVNGTGAKSVSVGGTTLTTSMLTYAGYGGRVAVYVYDGTLFRFVTWAYDANNTYSLSSFGITATAAELNLLDGVTATTAEINYLDGVTSSIQAQLNSKAASGHTHSYLSTGGGVVSGNVQQSGATTDYTTYKFRNIAVGTSRTPTSNSTYGGSGAIYIYCP